MGQPGSLERVLHLSYSERVESEIRLFDRESVMGVLGASLRLAQL